MFICNIVNVDVHIHMQMNSLANDLELRIRSCEVLLANLQDCSQTSQLKATSMHMQHLFNLPGTAPC